MADASVARSHLPFPDNVEILPAALWWRVGLINHLNGPGPSVEAASSGILKKESISWSLSINAHPRPPDSVSLISWRQGGGTASLLSGMGHGGFVCSASGQ